MEPNKDLQACKSQVDKAGKSYIPQLLSASEHCLTYEVKVVALLHDTIEGINVTTDCLYEQGFLKDRQGVLSVAKIIMRLMKNFCVGQQ